MVASRYSNPLVKVDIVTGRVAVCRIRELWLGETITFMTDAEYERWLKRTIASQRTKLAEICRVMSPTTPIVKPLEKAKDAKRSKYSPLPPEMLQYLLAELALDTEPSEIARKTGVALSTVYRIAREPKKYGMYLKVYELHEGGLGILEIVSQTGLSTGTIKNLVYKLWREDELVS